MPSRFAVSVLLASVWTVAVLAQESDVVIGSIKDRYSLKACGADGRMLLGRDSLDRTGHWSPEHSHWSLLGVSRDGSLVTFQFPEGLEPTLAAYDGSDVVVLSVDLHPRVLDPHDLQPSGPRYEMLRFDNQANLLTQQQVSIDFDPAQMAVLPSGSTMVVGGYREAGEDEVKNVGAVLDTGGQILKRFAFPLPPQGGGWTFVTYRMVAGDAAAYMVLYSYDPAATGIAKISEDGQLDIKIIPNPPYNDQRHHNQWLFGPGVAVEMYHYVGERSTFHFDEYDVDSGQRTASRFAFISGGGSGCYWRDEVSMQAASFHVDPARGLPPDTLRLVFAKLHDQPVSMPVVNPEACHCAQADNHHADH